jgi:hypothetical protein
MKSRCHIGGMLALALLVGLIGMSGVSSIKEATAQSPDVRSHGVLSGHSDLRASTGGLERQDDLRSDEWLMGGGPDVPGHSAAAAEAVPYSEDYHLRPVPQAKHWN